MELIFLMVELILLTKLLVLCGNCGIGFLSDISTMFGGCNLFITFGWMGSMGGRIINADEVFYSKNQDRYLLDICDNIVHY